VKTFAGLAALVVLIVGVSACGGRDFPAVVKVGAKPITKKQIDAVLVYDRSQYPKLHLTFPRPGSAEYLLLRQQAIDFLVEQSRAQQADARIGATAQDRVVSDAAFRKVTANVHVTDADVEKYFQQQGTKSQLDVGTATEIRQQLLAKRRAVVMHGFVAAAKRDYPVTYQPGYKPVSEIALARKIWTIHPSHHRCDLKPGFYQVPTAVEHGCAQSNGPSIVIDEKPCPIVDPPHAQNGFTGSEEADGFAEYAPDNAGTCVGDPRGAEVEVTAAQLQSHTPVKVSYLPQKGIATRKDPLLGFTLRYPRRLHIHPIAYGSLADIEGVEIANYSLGSSSPPGGWVPSSRPLSPGAVDLLITDRDAGTGPSARAS
jgi:hypothetical protein